MGRLYNILNAIMTPFGKELWSGIWSSGTITVPDSDKYLAFVIDQAGTPMLALRSGGNVRGYAIGGYPTGQNQLTRMFSCSVTGTSWTFEYSRYLSHTASGNHSAGSASNVTRIVGLVPNWGE